MEQLRPVSKLEKILFPIIVTIIVVMILPTTAPLVGMLMLGNLFRESGVVKQLQETASNALMYIVVILLGTSVGATTSAEAFLNISTIKIVILGLVAFAVGTAAGVLFGKLMCLATHGKVNPLIGSAGVSAVPMAARVSQKVGAEADPTRLLIDACYGTKRSRCNWYCSSNQNICSFWNLKLSYYMRKIGEIKMAEKKTSKDY